MKNQMDTTIAAISTAMSNSGIGIVRMSGPEAIDIAEKVYQGKNNKKLSEQKSHTIHYGYIVDRNIADRDMENRDITDRDIEDCDIEDCDIADRDMADCDMADCDRADRDMADCKNVCVSISEDRKIEASDKKDVVDGETIDEVLVMLMKGPHTYTGEDTVEINCHGGVYVVKRILELLIQNGARPAEPGEFTKRAFLNGKMDLSQAEAVGDLIVSQNEYALQSSVNQLKGSIKEKISDIRSKIIYQTAFIETALDEPEYIDVDGYGEKLKIVVDELLKEIQSLLATCDDGRIIKEGIQTVILGKPNAGKSSLLNVLLGEERAIVTDIAGTTRDVLEEHINLQGISLNIMDTAGIRDTGDIVEKIGVDKAKEYADKADLILYVIDASSELDENDYEILDLIQGKPAIILLNKSDLDMVISKEIVENAYNERNKNISKRNTKIDNCVPIIEISAKNNQGVELLEKELKNMFFEGNIKFNNEIYITNVRHKTALQDAYESLKKVNESIEAGMPEDFYSIDLLDAYESLGSITGETIGEDLVNEIFSKFCMGK